MRRTGAGGGKEAKAVVNEMQNRLVREIQEREAEAAIYSAKARQTARPAHPYVHLRSLQIMHLICACSYFLLLSA